MALNFELLQPANIGANFMAGQKEAQDLQTGKLAQQEAQLKLNDFQQKQIGLDKFITEAQKRGKNGTPEELANSFLDYSMSQRDPTLITHAMTMVQAANERKRYLESQNPNQLAGATQPTTRLVAPAGALGSGTFDPNAPPVAAAAPLNALAPAAAAPSAMASTNALAPTPAAPAQVDRIAQLKNRLSQLSQFQNVPEAKAEATMLLEEYKRLTTPHIVAPGGALVSGEGKAIFTAPERQDTDLIRNYNAAQKQGFSGSLFDYQQRITAAGRPAATPSAPVAVVDPASGKVKFVSREQAISGAMTPAAAMESLPPKEIQKREAALPAATSAIKGFESKSDAFITDLKSLRDHPGLSSITGLIYGRTPSATAEGRAAQALYDKVVAKGGFQALQDLRDASKTGGALGNVSNQEGSQLKSSFAAIDRVQDTPDVQAAIDQAIANIEGSKTRMREAYDSTYSYKTGNAPAAAPTPTPAGGSNVVVTPDGQSHTFPTPAAAAQFKKAAGIK